MQFGDVPFYSSPIIPFTDVDANGLGGYPTLRGFVTDRFVGDAAAYANGQLRWAFGEKMLWGQHLRFMLVPFVDTGRVFDSDVVAATDFFAVEMQTPASFSLWDTTSVRPLGVSKAKP